MDFFIDYKQVFIILHLLGLAMGFGGAIISDYLFFRFLEDLKISKQEEKVMGFVSTLVWLGLLLMLISGFLLFLSDVEGYKQSSKFLLKMSVVMVIALNGAFLHFYIKPRLSNIDWAPKLEIKKRGVKRLAFSSGAISITSWFLATVLGVMGGIPVDFLLGFFIYVGILVVVVIGGQMFEAAFTKYSK